MSLNRPSSMEHFDRSGNIAAISQDDPQPQVIFPRNHARIGLTFQNQGTNPMWLVVMQSDPQAKPTRYKINPDCDFYWDQFAPLNEICVEGTAGEPFAASEFGI